MERHVKKILEETILKEIKYINPSITESKKKRDEQ